MKTSQSSELLDDSDIHANLPAYLLRDRGGSQDIPHPLASALQVTLDLDSLISIFLSKVRDWVQCEGIEYVNEEQDIIIVQGGLRRHRCNYTLNMQGNCLGTITCTRSKRFTEGELETLEYLLSDFLYPIRNALQYRAALSATFTDKLTGVKNRAALDERLPQAVERSNRYATPLSLLLIEVQDYKKIIDVHGRDVGDQLLRAFSQLLGQNLRISDECFRYADDEFIVTLPNTDLDEVQDLMIGLDSEIRSLAVYHEHTKVQGIVAAGIAVLNPGEDAKSFLRRADEALRDTRQEPLNRQASAA